MKDNLRRFIERGLRRPAYWLLVLAAVVAVISALAGGSVGLDADQRWGEVRLITFVTGLVVLALAVADGVLNIIDRHFASGRDRRASPEFPNEGGPQNQSKIWSPIQRGLTVAVLFISAVALFLGLVTVWKWPDWPGSTYMYHSQAQAFVSGETALAVTPPPGLEELEDPYDPDWRQGIEVVTDLSYYEGRYYMYWGPAPAALSGLWLLAGGAPISDAVIVFLSVTAIFLFSFLTLLHLQRTLGFNFEVQL